MNKKWKKILDVKLLKSDKDKWGLMPIGRIKQGFLLIDDSEVKELISFIKGEIKVLDCEIRHNSKWSPTIYHPNAYISGKMEKRSFKIILKRLNNQ